MKIMVTIGDTILTGSLDETPEARDFATQLPLTLVLEDYAGTEKIADLPVRIESQDAAAGYAPRAGDLGYYAPWGNLAIFHKDFRHSHGLVRLGRLHVGLECLARQGRVSARIEILSP